jgi:hypothetical protein
MNSKFQNFRQPSDFSLHIIYVSERLTWKDAKTKEEEEEEDSYELASIKTDI